MSLLRKSLNPSRWSFPGMESIASSFNFQYFLISLWSEITCLGSIPHFPTHSIWLSTNEFQEMCPVPWVLLCLFVPKILSSSLTPRNTSSFLTRSVQLIVSILLQHHISKPLTLFRSTFRIGWFSAPQKTALQMQHSIVWSLNLSPGCWTSQTFPCCWILLLGLQSLI